MINIVTLVGTLIEDPVLKEFESGVKGAYLTLRVLRPFKSMDGTQESDFIRCNLWEGIAQNTCDYCHKGDVIGIRGRIAPRSQEITFTCDNTQHKKKIVTLEIVVERVAFISTARREKEPETSETE